MQVKLIVTGGKANKREVVLNLPATIGRSRDADLTVGHRMISRKHCEAYSLDGLMMIRDVGSLNGTYVRGGRIHEAPLPPGAKFSIGPITFRVSYEYSGDSSKLPPIVPDGAVPDNVKVKDSQETEPRTQPTKHPVHSPPDDDELDFKIVEGDDDDFELAIQESLDDKPQPKKPQPKKPEPKKQEPKKPETKPSQPKKPDPEPAEKEEDDGEKDLEDQLLDDFLNDLQ